MDCRGQGGSTLGNGQTTDSRAAAATARMMGVLDIEQAHFFGASDGGCIRIGLLLDFDGLTDEPQPRAPMDAIRAKYAAESPQPEKFIEIVKGQRHCWATEPDVSLRRLSAIKRPVLVVSTRADECTPKTAFDALENAIPGARSVFFEDLEHMPLKDADRIAAALAAVRW